MRLLVEVNDALRRRRGGSDRALTSCRRRRLARVSTDGEEYAGVEADHDDAQTMMTHGM